MQEIRTDRYTRQELYWAIVQYRAQFTQEVISERTFRHWRQKLEIEPDRQGLFWQSDLQRLQTLVVGLSQGLTIEQVANQLADSRQENQNYAYI